MTHESNYRKILKAKLEERCQANPRYSLRAFARDLELSPSRLCLILKNKQGLSEEFAKRIAKSLNFTATESAHFINLVLASDARKKDTRIKALKDLTKKINQNPEQRLLQVEAFKIISDWYHFAILELTKVKGFKGDSGWIAKRLNISSHQVEGAVERLLNLKLLQYKKGKLVATDTRITTDHTDHAEANRRFHQQILEKALNATTFQPIEERDYTGVTVAIRVADLPEYRRRITEFRRELNRFAETSIENKSADEVYNLSIQFFRISEKEKEKEKGE